jgi:hypothetical protein
MYWAFSSQPTSRHCIFIHRTGIDLLQYYFSCLIWAPHFLIGMTFRHPVGKFLGERMQQARSIVRLERERADLIRFIVTAYVLQPFYFEKSGEDAKSSVKP